MRKLSSLGLLASFVLLTGEAKPCGGAFGASFTIQPDQKIVVSYHDGIETYVMNPNFCGKADSFGLVLPIPSVLQRNPELGTQQLYADLAAFTAPTIVTVQQCQSTGGRGSMTPGAAGAGNWSDHGTTVIQRGQVGIFDFALLKANSVNSFTDWLSTNGFPNKAAASTFQPYVDQGWYFIAFRVSTGLSGVGTAGSAGSAGKGNATVANAGEAGTTVCGSFGPISLSFLVGSQPVIPARIATVSSSAFQWDIFAVMSQKVRLKDVATALRFAGPIEDADFIKYANLGALAKPGDRVTELLLTRSPTDDLTLDPDPDQSDYRRTETIVQYVTCRGGSPGGGAFSNGGGSPGGGAFSNGGGASGRGAGANGGGSSGASAVVDRSGGSSVGATGPDLGSGGTDDATATSGSIGGATWQSGRANGGAISAAAGPPSVNGGATSLSVTGASSSSGEADVTSRGDDSGCVLVTRAGRSEQRGLGRSSVLAALAVLWCLRRRRCQNHGRR